MTYIIAEPCIDIKDLSCVDVCPVDCIHEFDRMLIIDPEECIDCGACEPECQVEARHVELRAHSGSFCTSFAVAYSSTSRLTTSIPSENA